MSNLATFTKEFCRTCSDYTLHSSQACIHCRTKSGGYPVITRDIASLFGQSPAQAKARQRRAAMREKSKTKIKQPPAQGAAGGGSGVVVPVPRNHETHLTTNGFVVATQGAK